VVLVLTPGTVSERDLDQAIERVNRLGIPVLGVILDLDGTSSQLVPLTRAAS
jgi:Mrp family chromosome partitioning ATPase